ncbi:MAG: hypothetical protein FWF00_01490 [Endomicrobia bacterium]|nr:hypothetical protein [Endomicrobiia bacterium]MCL2506349.1 hypothetical protein [Endomicrobiia bacterium]
MFSIKTKAIILSVLIFLIGFACGYISKKAVQAKESYSLQHRFERLEPLTQALELTALQKALLLNILADNKTAIDNIMKQVNPKINIQLHMLRENIKGILDDRQKEIYLRLLQEHEERMIRENQ